MEPITTTIVAAIASGALAGTTNVATEAIKDAYQGLKHLITSRYKSAATSVAKVEAQPDSSTEHASLAKQLESAGAGTDKELSAAAQALLDAIDKLRGVEAAAPLFDFDRLRVARNLELNDISALGTVFRGRDVEVSGDFKASGIHQTAPSKKTSWS